MQQTQSGTRTSRVQYVAMSANLFLVAMAGVLTIEDLEDFSNAAEANVEEKDREMFDYIKDDLTALTNHASSMRTVVAKIVLLREGLIPALKIDRNNLVLRLQAVQAMGFIRAECEAMTCLLQ